MTRKEIQEYAKNVLIKACEQVEFDGENIDEDGSIKIHVKESNFGEINFHIDFHAVDVARFSVIYSAQPYVEAMIKKMLEIKEKYKNDKNFLTIFEESYKERIEGIATFIASMVLEEFNDIVAVIPTTAERIYSEIMREDLLELTKTAREKAINKILNEVNSNRKTRLLEMLDLNSSSISAPQYLFCDVYNSQLEIWKDAKRCYNQNKKYKNPLEMVKSAFVNLPDDLITQLADPDTYTAQASTIALENTARILNVPKNIVSDRTLRRYLKESITQRRGVTDDDAKEALSEYMNNLNDISIMQIRQLRTLKRTFISTSH